MSSQVRILGIAGSPISTRSDSMRIAVLGAGGGLGRNVVDAARAAKHDVVALVRDPKRAELPDDVTTVVGDATHVDDVVRAMAGADATMFCVNPPFATWLTTFPPLLACAIAAARKTNTRLVFPANVWIYGPGRAGELVAETRAPAPTSQRGKLRAEMEQQIRAAGIRYAIVRLPEFYGPNVVSVPAPVFQAALADRRALWPGSLDVAVELVYIPDAGRAMVAVAAAADCDGATFHLPGARTTPRQFVELVYQAAGRKPRAFGVPRWYADWRELVERPDDLVRTRPGLEPARPDDQRGPHPRLPGGLQLLRHVRQEATLKELPILVMTGKTLTAEESALLRNETQALLHKNGSWPQQLIAEVGRLIEGRKLTKSAGQS